MAVGTRMPGRNVAKAVIGRALPFPDQRRDDALFGNIGKRQHQRRAEHRRGHQAPPAFDVQARVEKCGGGGNQPDAAGILALRDERNGDQQRGIHREGFPGEGIAHEVERASNRRGEIEFADSEHDDRDRDDDGQPIAGRRRGKPVKRAAPVQCAHRGDVVQIAGDQPAGGQLDQPRAAPATASMTKSAAGRARPSRTAATTRPSIAMAAVILKKISAVSR